LERLVSVFYFDLEVSGVFIFIDIYSTQRDDSQVSLKKKQETCTTTFTISPSPKDQANTVYVSFPPIHVVENQSLNDCHF
jgi:hypothetical protein